MKLNSQALAAIQNESPDDSYARNGRQLKLLRGLCYLKALYGLNRLFIPVRKKSAKGHKDVRCFRVDLFKLMFCSITFSEVK